MNVPELSQIYDKAKASFMICQSCYWCASLFRVAGNFRCPCCKNEITDSLPIFSNEYYQLELRNGGVELKFGEA